MFFYRVVDVLRRCRVEILLDSEDFAQLVLEPRARWGCPEQVPMVGEHLPDPARILLRDWSSSIYRCYAERFERDPLRVKHSQDVVIRRYDERRRIGERIVLGEDRRIHV